MTLEITFEKAHLNVPTGDNTSLVSNCSTQRSYILFRVNDQVEYTLVRHGT